VERAVKEMMGQKATAVDDISGDVLILLGENGLKLTIQQSLSYMRLESGLRISLKLQQYQYLTPSNRSSTFFLSEVWLLDFFSLVHVPPHTPGSLS
jgi:hypothetical protein